MPSRMAWRPASRPPRIAGQNGLGDLDRQGLPEDLLAGGVIAGALREAPPGQRNDRALTANITVAGHRPSPVPRPMQVNRIYQHVLDRAGAAPYP